MPMRRLNGSRNVINGKLNKKAKEDKETMDNKLISEYMAEIGRRGGKASKGTDAAKERARKAAKARWAKAKKDEATP